MYTKLKWRLRQNTTEILHCGLYSISRNGTINLVFWETRLSISDFTFHIALPWLSAKVLTSRLYAMRANENKSGKLCFSFSFSFEYSFS
jgi:hypothetical protein